MSYLEWSADKLTKQIRFGLARGLTRVAKAAATDVQDDLSSVFDRPTPFTLRAVASSWATPDTLTSTVFIRPDQLDYLSVQITGGERTPEPGSPVNVPGAANLNAYGNLPRRAIKRYIAQKTTFVADGKGRTAHLKPGIYRRAKSGKRRRGGKGTLGAVTNTGSLSLLVGFKPVARYGARFGFVKLVERSVNRNLNREINASIDQALMSAR